MPDATKRSFVDLLTAADAADGTPPLFECVHRGSAGADASAEEREGARKDKWVVELRRVRS